MELRVAIPVSVLRLKLEEWGVKRIRYLRPIAFIELILGAKVITTPRAG